MHPKIGVHPTGTDPANFIHAMPAYLRGLGACGLKWVGGFAKNGLRGLRNIHGCASAQRSGHRHPVGRHGLRLPDGAAHGRRQRHRRARLRPAGARTLALVGCGFEGMMLRCLRFLLDLIPTLREVRLRDIRPEAMEALRTRARGEFGFEGEILVCPTIARASTGRT